MNYSQVKMVGWFINLFVWLASVMLGLRVLFEIFSASTSAVFVHWVYQNSAPLLNPFREVFAVTAPNSGHNVDWAALFAITAYGVIGYALGKWVTVYNGRRR